LKDGETLEDLQYKGLKIIQSNSGFRFGTDAVLLANFARIYSGNRVADLGTGTGIVAILIAGKTKAGKIVGVEIQEKMADMARRSVKINGLQDRIEILTGDLRDITMIGKNIYNAVICNPPYRKVDSGMVNMSDNHRISRYEVGCTLLDVIESARALLMNMGRFYMIHQAERLAEVIYLLRLNRLEPKRLRMIHPKPGYPPNLFLIEAVKGAKSHIAWMPPLYVFDEHGEYTPEMKRIYNIEVNS
ncbi:MAG TPA: tRNA1(Val) (adenine(37)-N6)-methyltransferase, partial [Clostridia bacterium]|nr:tRNA1(Val) (adenine(37)-N6)-methyltransferase [Clostridia bacterium]